MIDKKEIFSNRLKIDKSVRSIDSLFNNEERLKSTNYNPSYQRNYVWSEEKATYFIESILIGTEIPPLILFVNKDGYEIIDGRQRYETILKFKNGELTLKKAGLHRLSHIKEIRGKSFLNLPEDYKEMFLDTKIRIFEISFFSKEYTEEEELAVKREIFKRYNNGMTPLKNSDTDRAKYHDNSLNTLIEEVFDKEDLWERVNMLLGYDKLEKSKLMRKVRGIMTRHIFPIRYYINHKADVASIYFDFISDKTDLYSDVHKFIERLNITETVIEKIKEVSEWQNKSLLAGSLRLMAECIMWGLAILEQDDEHISFDYHKIHKLANEFFQDSDLYTYVRSSFSGSIMKRYSSAAKCFKNVFGKDFYSAFVESKDLNLSQSSIIKHNEQQSIECLSFEELRISKPEVSSENINDIMRKMSKNKWLIRPAYQRKEVNNLKEASSIIESLLLGMLIPPLFVYKRNDGVYEVIDGQQRLLSIIGFIGAEYKDIDGENKRSNKNLFKLNLKNAILTDLNSKRYSDLDENYKRAIRDADLGIIEIQEKTNPNFDPIDLFLRLNLRPFPIKQDTFEMWNSYVEPLIIQTAKDISNNVDSWFYLRRKDSRMENPDLIMILAYVHIVDGIIKHSNNANPLDIFVQGGLISIRIKQKEQITRALNGETKDISRNDFIDALNFVDYLFIYPLRNLISKFTVTNSSLSIPLDTLLNVKRGKRTLQGFYLLWEVLNGLSPSDESKSEDYINLYYCIKDLINVMTVPSISGDLDYTLDPDTKLKRFREKIYKIRESYGTIKYPCGIGMPLKYLLKKNKNENENKKYLVISKEPISNKGFSAGFKEKLSSEENNSDDASIDINYISLESTRSGINPGFIKAILESKYFYELAKRNQKLTKQFVLDFSIPYAEFKTQLAIDKILKYKNKSTIKDTRFFFENIIDISVLQLYFPTLFESEGIDIISFIDQLTKKNLEDIKSVYAEETEDINIPINEIKSLMIQVSKIEEKIYNNLTL